jgi:NitT/TauT family transport system substrate-binding protein
MSIAQPLSRRRFLKSAGVGAGGLALPRLVFAQSRKPIHFTLPWVAEGSNLFTFVAKGMGFWDKHGLDVDTMGVGVLNDGAIKTPKDLEGRRMASVVTSGEYPFLPLFAERAGFDLEKVTRIHVDNKVRDRLLSEGKVDAISGFASSAMPSYAATGVNAHFMLFSDYGILNYGTTVMTQPARVAQEPELCAAFVDGILEGLKATILDPAEAMKVFFKQVPEMALAAQAREQIRVGTGILIYVAARDIIKTNGMGYIEPKDYEAMTDLVMKYLAHEGDQRPDIAGMMTNHFIGGLKLSPAEWDQAQKNAAEFRSYVS